MEHKIGEIFEYNGEWYQCVKCVIYCPNCDFFRKKCNSQVLGECGAVKRSDKENVIFKKLEKVGEPFTSEVHIQFQRYKIYTEPIIGPAENLGYVNDIGYVNEENTIAIEIKQNKEDMEEEREYSEEEFKNNPRFQHHKPIEQVTNMKKMKPFNLEEAKAGKPVCTKDGRKARIICFDAKGDYPIIALIDNTTKETGLHYTLNGTVYVCTGSGYDLMMLPEKKEGWVNIVRGSNGSPHMGRGIFQSKEEAENAIKEFSDNLIDTVKISWEESE